MSGCRQSLKQELKRVGSSFLKGICMRSLRSWSLATIAIAFAHPAFAWGPDGLHTVGTLAEKLIAGTNAATQVQALLGTLSLADAAVWADCAKGVNPSTFKYEHPGKYKECTIFETPAGEAQMEDFVRRNATNCPLKPGEEIC